MLAVAAVGCTEPMPVDCATVLAPGREMRMAFRSEMQMDVSAMGGTPGSSLVSMDIELPMIVIAIPESDSLRITMTVHRVRSGCSYTVRGETKHEESIGFEAGGPTQPKSEFWSILCDTKFVAVVDSQGRFASADAVGKYWTDLEKEFAQSVEKQGVSQAHVDMILRGQTLGVFSALEDAMAYLPPNGLQTSQSWQVRRERVFPYRAFEFGMTTGGLYTKEEATCSALSVKVRGLHSIATIAIRGKRFPRNPEWGMPARVKHLDLKGELEVNLNTGAIEKLRLESTPMWISPEDKAFFKIKFVQVITLKPT
jgi:hypothetical protein